MDAVEYLKTLRRTIQGHSFTAAAKSLASLPATGFMSLRPSTMHRMT